MRKQALLMVRVDSFSQELLSIRQFLGISQAELASRCGLPASSISHFEAENRKPSFESLIAIANALNVSLDRLVFGLDEIEVIEEEA